MFTICKEDIQKLSDKDLRCLIGKLCEAELRKNNIPTSGITYSGDQDAADGGIDVCVQIDDKYHIEGYIPRNCTGFQVKVHKMSSSDIKKEMRPNGNLRCKIKEIALCSGSYIIVSGNDDTSLSMLDSRLNAMQQAIAEYPASDNIKLDFYDCQRVCTWVNEYASLIQWVHIRIGTLFFGWQPYSNWSDPKGNIDEEFITDGVNIVKVGNDQYCELSAIEGINEIRSILNSSTATIRLVGLSGVGKTRFIQALCDNRLGYNAINPDYIVYTDTSHSPIPTPEAMIGLLTAQSIKSILIVDNCQPDLHRVLSQILQGYKSKGITNVSLLTVEYDIQTDQIEEVIVFKLEPSIEFVGHLLKQRYNTLSEDSIARIEAFSGGNARIALILAGMLKIRDNISMFSDDQLFSRLFWQGKGIDNELFDVAKACSVVFSFSIEESDMELNALAQIAGISVNNFYKHVQELLRRGLMQSRDNWLSVLPHVLGNWLADRALKDIPINHIRKSIEECESSRLLRSFSRRLGYLSNSVVAKKAIDDWFSSAGLLANISKLNDNSIKILYNIAPLCTERILSAIEQIEGSNSAERFFSTKNTHFRTFMGILRGIAYDAIYFERCANLLVRFDSAISRMHTYDRNDRIEGLFQLNLSGTHAPADMRLSVINSLIKKGGAHAVQGFEFLDSALRTSCFHANFPRDFGSRNRDAGFSPKDTNERKAWYAYFITYIQDLYLQGIFVEETKQLFLKHLQELLLDAEVIEEATAFIINVLKNDEWLECWVVIKNIIYQDHIIIPDNIQIQLKNLEILIAPKTDLENALTTILLDDSGKFYFDEENKESIRLKYIAQRIAKDEDALKKLIAQVIYSEKRNIWPLAVELAKNCSNPKDILDFSKELVAHNRDDELYPHQFLGGFLWGLNNDKPELVEAFLEEAVDNELAYIFPLLQFSITVTKQGKKRILRSIEKLKLRSMFYSPIRAANPGVVHNELYRILSLLECVSKFIIVSTMQEVCGYRLNAQSPNTCKLAYRNGWQRGGTLSI